ncbi:hypothetical protein ACKVWC_011554 [Pyricularia oryzae]
MCQKRRIYVSLAPSLLHTLDQQIISTFALLHNKASIDHIVPIRPPQCALQIRLDPGRDVPRSHPRPGQVLGDLDQPAVVHLLCDARPRLLVAQEVVALEQADVHVGPHAQSVRNRILDGVVKRWRGHDRARRPAQVPRQRQHRQPVKCPRRAPPCDGLLGVWEGAQRREREVEAVGRDGDCFGRGGVVAAPVLQDLDYAGCDCRLSRAGRTCKRDQKSRHGLVDVGSGGGVLLHVMTPSGNHPVG